MWFLILKVYLGKETITHNKLFITLINMVTQKYKLVSTSTSNIMTVLVTGMLVPWMFSVWLVGSQAARQSPRNTSSYGKFREVFQWNQVDFAFPSQRARQTAISNKTFIPENNLPLGIEVTLLNSGQYRLTVNKLTQIATKICKKILGANYKVC